LIRFGVIIVQKGTTPFSCYLLYTYVPLPEEYDRRFLRHGLVAIIRYSFLRVKGNVNWFIMQKRVNAP